ncbi:winged helix-turn-helix transcriptional regulator [Pseudomonas sp. TTU2014-080ASC]|uniref:winged helix-turn-helix transcriptional regulator n=1 Tax=Pseudomonas sp. TTU2014-080ASC TaxID=1729724 RepID=UPI000A890130|nr:helix-turn-helix domain-containing protein [Pseudomonas sp. TTU2014-080ASC]
MSDTDTHVRDSGIQHAGENCRTLAETLARIGDKWTVLVVSALQDGSLRYNELHRRIGGISQRMLTLTLKSLEQDGIVERTVYPTIPPRVDYTLTDLGRSLLTPLQALFQWAIENRPLMLQAREKFQQSDRQGAAQLKSFTVAPE